MGSKVAYRSGDDDEAREMKEMEEDIV
nr:hypothetical protein [Tanacetum cinerariifolium]